MYVDVGLFNSFVNIANHSTAIKQISYIYIHMKIHYILYYIHSTHLLLYSRTLTMECILFMVLMHLLVLDASNLFWF